MERINSSVQWWDRWRWIGVAFYAGLVAYILHLLGQSTELIERLAGNCGIKDPLLRSSIVAGATVGAAMGWMLQQAVAGVVNALTGLRTERLLVKHFDDVAADPTAQNTTTQ